MLCRKRIIEATFLSVLDYGDIIYRHAACLHTQASGLCLPLSSEVYYWCQLQYNTHHCALYDMVGCSSLTERRNNHWNLFIQSPRWKTATIHLIHAT